MEHGYKSCFTVSASYFKNSRWTWYWTLLIVFFLENGSGYSFLVFLNWMILDCVLDDVNSCAMEILDCYISLESVAFYLFVFGFSRKLNWLDKLKTLSHLSWEIAHKSSALFYFSGLLVAGLHTFSSRVIQRLGTEFMQKWGFAFSESAFFLDLSWRLWLSWVPFLFPFIRKWENLSHFFFLFTLHSPSSGQCQKNGKLTYCASYFF